MKIKLLMAVSVCLFSLTYTQSQEILITTNSGSASWSPVRVTNSGVQLSWSATNTNIGTIIENTNDPTFNFSSNTNNLPIAITVSGSNGFVGLSNFRILSNGITDIDLSQTTDLTNLFLTGNAISMVDVSGNTNLSRLLIASNELTILDIGSNPSLDDLRINNNQLSSAVLDKIVNDLDVFGLSGGRLQIANNAGVLTFASRVAYDNLTSRGWNIDVGTPPDVPNDLEAPSAVTTVVASSTTINSTELNWTASTDNIGVTDYDVFQDGANIGSTGGATLFNVTGLDPVTSYNFTVFARDAVGNVSAAGNTEIVLTLADTDAPDAITDLAFSNTTFSSTDLFWSAPQDNIGVTDYQVFQDGGILGLTGGATSFNATGLAPLTSFDFTVFAMDAEGNTSLVSNTVNVITLAAPDNEAPDAITDLASSNISFTTVDLSWSTPFDNIGVIDYEVFQNGASLGLTGLVNTLNVTGLIPGNTYNFTIFAKDGGGNNSAVSNAEPVTTLTDGTAPDPVTDLAASNTLLKSTDLNWTAVVDNVGVIDYEVFQDGGSIGLTGGVTSFNVSGLSSGTSYQFTVFAKDAAGNTSASSNVLDVTTLSAIDYTSDNANSATFDWEARDLFADRNVGIGTLDTQGYRLAVSGNIVAEEIKVALKVNWPDYVFEDSYSLPNLTELEAYIRSNGHLMGIPSAKEVEENGIQLGEMNALLLEKIEELTLYTLDQQKQINDLKNQLALLEQLLKQEQNVEFNSNHQK